MTEYSTPQENIETQEGESKRDAYIASIKILEVVCYFVSLFISSLAFAIIFEIQFFSPDTICFSILILVATLVFKSQLLLWGKRYYSKKMLKKLMNSFAEATKEIKKMFSRLTILLIIAKILLFNILSDCFLLLLFFFPSMMLFVFIKGLFYPSAYSHLFDWGLTFFGIAGVLLGIFQYYLYTNRNTVKKAAERLDKMVNSTISSETTYDNFRKHVFENEYQQAFKKHVEEVWYQKNPLAEPVKAICDIDYSDKSDSDITKMKKIVKAFATNVQVHVTRERFSSEQCYLNLDIMETDGDKHRHMNEMLRAYCDFFFGKDIDNKTCPNGCKDKIIQKITNDCNLAELGSLFLSNINLIIDDGQEFIFGNLGDAFWMALSLGSDSSSKNNNKNDTKEFKTHTDYMRLLTQEIYFKVVWLIFEPYFKQKNSTKQTMTESITKL